LRRRRRWLCSLILEQLLRGVACVLVMLGAELDGIEQNNAVIAGEFSLEQSDGLLDGDGALLVKHAQRRHVIVQDDRTGHGASTEKKSGGLGEPEEKE